MLTALCITVATFALIIFGLPISFILCSKKEDKSECWVFAPIMGLTIITLLLQNLVYIDIPIQKSTPWLWASAIFLWTFIIFKRPFFSYKPSKAFLSLFALSLGIYLIQGLGLLLAGAEIYVGRAWHDFMNYTFTSQFMADYPFSLSIADVQNQPYLYEAIVKKTDRIGPSIFQAFLSVSTFSSAKTSFEPAILLSPFLIVFSIYALARSISFSHGRSLAIAGMAGLLPGITMIHLESFFSQALGMPYLLLWPVFIHRLITGQGWKHCISAAIMLAGLTTMYTEFYLLIIGLSFIALGGEFYQIGKSRFLLTRIPLLISIVGLAILFNLGFIRAIFRICQRVSWVNVLEGIYPWAFSLEGLKRLWLGDLATRFGGHGGFFFDAFILFLIFGSAFGFVYLAFRRTDGMSIAILSLFSYFSGGQAININSIKSFSPFPLFFPLA